jgi:hypothetical protein
MHVPITIEKKKEKENLEQRDPLNKKEKGLRLP